MSAGRIESVRIRGFRSLADVELSNLQNANVLIGANGSGKSNFIRFFEMLRWMLRSRRLGEFVELHGGADDQLYGGNSVTPRMEGELALRTDKGRNDYRFTLSYAHPDRFIFTQEAYRFSAADYPTDAPWKYVSSGNREAGIVDLAQASPSPGVNPLTARVLVHLLKSCQVFQFHDTSDTSNFKKRWDAEDNNYLRTHGGNLCRAFASARRGRRPTVRADLRAHPASAPGLRLFRVRRELWKGVVAMEGGWNGQDLRRASYVRWITPLLRSGHFAEPATGDVAERVAAGRAGAWLAPCRHCVGRRHDQVACGRPAGHRSHTVAVARRCIRARRNRCSGSAARTHDV